MKMRHPKTFILGALMILCAPEPAAADGVDLHQVLRGPERCDHVIDLMMRYGVNQAGNAHHGPLLHHSPMGSLWVPHEELGDLALVEVAALPVNDPVGGPSFAVVIQNNSKRDVCGFRISVVALLGRITAFSPTTVVKVDTVGAGQATEVHVQLPIESLAMGMRNGQPIEFTRLIVAIDSFDQFAECNEANNIQVFARTAIPCREVAVETTAVVSPGEMTTPTVEASPGVAPALGGEAQRPAPSGPAPSGPAPSGPASQPQPPQAQPPANDDLQSAINRLDLQNSVGTENQSAATSL